MQTTTARETKITAFLHGKWERSREYQQRQGAVFDLSFEDYCQLWKNRPYMFSVLRGHILANTVWEFMASEKGYVLTWANKEAFKARVMNIHTARIDNKKMSQRVCHMQKGEKHTDQAKAKISASKMGVKHTEQHKASVSAALSGVPKTAESNAKRAEAMRAHWAAKRANATESSRVVG